MGYLHISNLYKEQDILLFKECWALEKIHGTSAHIFMDGTKVNFHHGGANADAFNALFNPVFIQDKYNELFEPGTKVYLYGEAYGGRVQKMSHVYGPDLRFIVFDVKIGDCWLDVQQAEHLADQFLLDFVHYWKASTVIEDLDQCRDMFSPQAIRNGMGNNHHMEGVVLRPLLEVTKNNGERIIAKHKREEFSETTTPRKVVDPTQLQILTDARAIADEWVTAERLNHVLDKLGVPATIENTGAVIRAMVEDVLREAEGEIEVSKTTQQYLGKKTAQMFKSYLQSQLRD